MAKIKVVKGCGPFEYDCHGANAARDFSVIMESDFPTESINADWQSISNCLVTGVIVEPTKDIDGRVYNNVVTARISQLASPLAETRLTVTGVSSGEIVPYRINIPVST